MDKKETFGAEVAKRLPIKEIYNDVAHPTLSTVGQALQDVTKVALAPVSALVWGYDKIALYLDVAIPEYFAKRNIENGKIQMPDPVVAGPTIEAMRYTSHKSELREMFTNLLGASMNMDTAEDAHPAFIEIIKQLTSDECKILDYLKLIEALPMVKVRHTFANTQGGIDITPFFSDVGELAGCSQPFNIAKYFVNLNRLGIISLISDRHLMKSGIYDSLQNHSYILSHQKPTLPNGDSYEIIKGYFELTEFGKLFCDICIYTEQVTIHMTVE